MRRRISRFLRTAAIYRGLLGGSRPWMVVFGFFALGRVRRAVFGRTPESVAIEVLAPGQTVSITALEPPPRGRRARRRQAQSSE